MNLPCCEVLGSDYRSRDKYALVKYYDAVPSTQVWIDKIEKIFNLVRRYWAKDGSDLDQAHKLYGLVLVESVLVAIHVIRIDKALADFDISRDWERAFFYVNRFYIEKMPLFEVCRMT